MYTTYILDRLRAAGLKSPALVGPLCNTGDP